jgi:DNA-directed RNA polymerase specialized sigma24 family protein
MMPMGTVDNEEKKKFLRGYRDSVRRIKRIGAEIDELRTMRMGTSAGNGGGRCKGRKCDLSGYAASLDRLERDLEEERKGRVRVYERITEAINGLEDTKEQDVLFYRYIKGMTWWEIAEKMLYSERWVYMAHGRALTHLELPKECIELQS